MRKTITVKYLQSIGACSKAIIAHKEQSERGTLKVLKLLIKSDRLDWCNWIITRLMTKEQRIRYACYAAKQVLKNFESKYPNDKRPREAINAALRYLKTPSAKNRSAARSAAESAARSAAWSAESAARSAARSAESAILKKILRHGIKLLIN